MNFPNFGRETQPGVFGFRARDKLAVPRERTIIFLLTSPSNMDTPHVQYIASVMRTKKAIYDTSECSNFVTAQAVLEAFYRGATERYGDVDQEQTFRYIVARLCKWDTISEEDAESPHYYAASTFLLVLLLLAQQGYSKSTRSECLSLLTPDVVNAANSVYPDNILLAFFRNGPPLTDVLIDEILPLFPDHILFQVEQGQGLSVRRMYPGWNCVESDVITPLLALPLTVTHPVGLVLRGQQARASALYAKFLEFFIQRMPIGFLSENRGSENVPRCFGAYLVAYAAWWAEKDPTASLGEFFPMIFQREDSLTADMWDVLDTAYHVRCAGMNDTISIRSVIKRRCPAYLRYIEACEQ